MLTLTIVCDRCSKETVMDLSDTSFTSEDQIRKAGFMYIHANKKNMLICTNCNKGFKELVELQEEKAFSEVCEFFNNCEGTKNGYNSGAKNDRV